MIYTSNLQQYKNFNIFNIYLAMKHNTKMFIEKKKAKEGGKKTFLYYYIYNNCV